MKRSNFTFEPAKPRIFNIHANETTTILKIASLVSVRIELTTLALLAPRSTY